MNTERNTPKATNRLINEKSPYLLQHAENPVDWYPWGPEAFEKAKREDKPIFLSIGYSTCHWCHVMAHESFEDPEVAHLMNDAFVSIKVDREERPDIDHVYMTACQLLTGSGGWPLTILMTPDKKPFFAGTYLPKEARFGRIGMVEFVPHIKELWKTKRDDLLNSSEEITEELQQMVGESPGETLGEETLEHAFHQLEDRYDQGHGGFDSGPKFPTPHNFTFLLRYWKRTRNAKALEMVEKSLQAMRLGGIYDHVGFGFHRYSVDAEWFVPHFEKMLYDQALLVIAYLEAYQATGKSEYAETAREVLEYVMRDLADSKGGFYSSEDADSEGVEGKFYLWTEEEIKQSFPPSEADLVLTVYHTEPSGNFTEEASHEKTGTNILYLTSLIQDHEFRKRLDEARKTLFEKRSERIRPHRDDKVLTDWNGLMIVALAKAAQVLNEEKYANAAVRTTQFILERLRSKHGRLLHRYREGEAAIPAYLNDYAFFVWGLLELYQATFDANHLETAVQLNEQLLKHFWDQEKHGFYFTADDAENLIVRHKEVYDGAIPSGNSVALLNLLRLSHLTGNFELEKTGAKLVQAFSQSIAKSPSGFTHLLAGIDFALGPSFSVVVAGKSKEKKTQEIIRTIQHPFIPNKVILFLPTEAKTSTLSKMAEFTQALNPIDQKTTVFVCQNGRCQLPTTDVEKALEQLRGS